MSAQVLCPSAKGQPKFKPSVTLDSKGMSREVFKLNAIQPLSRNLASLQYSFNTWIKKHGVSVAKQGTAKVTFAYRSWTLRGDVGVNADEPEAYKCTKIHFKGVLRLSYVSPDGEVIERSIPYGGRIDRKGKFHWDHRLKPSSIFRK